MSLALWKQDRVPHFCPRVALYSPVYDASVIPTLLKRHVYSPVIKDRETHVFVMNDHSYASFAYIQHDTAGTGGKRYELAVQSLLNSVVKPRPLMLLFPVLSDLFTGFVKQGPRPD